MWTSASSSPGRRTGRLRRALADRRGTAAEFAIVGSTLMLMILAATDLGRYYLTLHALRTAAADAGRAAMISPLAADCGSGAVQTAARGGILGANFSLTVTCPRVSGMSDVTVTATRPFNFVIPVFGHTSLTLTEQARFRFAS